MTRVDLYLLLTAIIWGSNYSVIKFVLQEVPPRTFNALPLSIASAVFLVVIYATRRREHVVRMTGRDRAVRLSDAVHRRSRANQRDERVDHHRLHARRGEHRLGGSRPRAADDGP